MNMSGKKLEGIVLDVRKKIRTGKSYIFIAENLQGEILKINPYLYKKIEGITLNGKEVYGFVGK